MDKAFADTDRHCPSCPSNSREMVVSTSTCICHLHHHRQISIDCNAKVTDDGRCCYSGAGSALANRKTCVYYLARQNNKSQCFRIAIVVPPRTIEPRSANHVTSYGCGTSGTIVMTFPYYRSDDARVEGGVQPGTVPGEGAF